MSKKYLYCGRCQNYPNEIVESAFAQIIRKWNGEEYEIVHQGINESDVISFCGVCNAELSEREEQGCWDTAQSVRRNQRG